MNDKKIHNRISRRSTRTSRSFTKKRKKKTIGFFRRERSNNARLLGSSSGSRAGRSPECCTHTLRHCISCIACHIPPSLAPLPSLSSSGCPSLVLSLASPPLPPSPPLPLVSPLLPSFALCLKMMFVNTYYPFLFFHLLIFLYSCHHLCFTVSIPLTLV